MNVTLLQYLREENTIFPDGIRGTTEQVDPDEVIVTVWFSTDHVFCKNISLLSFNSTKTSNLFYIVQITHIQPILMSTCIPMMNRHVCWLMVVFGFSG